MNSVLDALLAKSVQDILVAVLLEREDPWYLRDLAKRLNRTPSTLQRPLDSLVRAGILKKWADGNRAYFAANEECPVLPELRGLLAKTVGLADVLRNALSPLSTAIQVAFIYGSVARREERAESDVDLLVVGKVGLADLSPELSIVERRLRRPVNATILSPTEFSRKLGAKNHFLRSVLNKEKIFVAGTEHDLERLAKPRPRRDTRYEQGRTR